MQLRQNIIKVIFGICVLLFLQGCLNVNLKSVLPNQTYYSLDTTSVTQQCAKKTNTFALNVSVLSPYDSKDILLYNSKQEIKTLDNYKWIDLPKNMIRNAFIKTAANQCLQIEQNPLLSQRLNMVRINVYDLYVLNDGQTNKAHIYMTYEVLGHDMRRIKEGDMQTDSTNDNPAIAMQSAMNEALQKIAQELKK